MATPSFSIRTLTTVEAESWVKTGQRLTGGSPELAVNRLVPALHAADRDPGEFLVAEGARGQFLGLLRCRFRQGARAEAIAPLIPDASLVDEVGRSLLARFLAECWGRQIKHIAGTLLLDPPQGDPEALDQLFLAMGFSDHDEQTLIEADLRSWSAPEDTMPLIWRNLHDLGNIHFNEAMAAIDPSGGLDVAADLLAMRGSAGQSLEPQRWKIGYRDGIAVGLVIPQAWPSDPKTGSFFRLAVHPEHQEKGYGRTLFNEGIRELKDAWVETYVGGVDLRTVPCQRLFAPLEYRVIEVQRRYHGPPLE